uniref:Efflux RND transporter periplasmic adaptor subunit n=1 Tax=Desertifilum tharense IPPAS B-1220 TaxID=1781255 RepID=A0ACD5GXF7_9CYAN
MNQAEVALEGTRLYAPFDGIVAYLNIRENEYYSLQAVSSQLGNYQELLNRVPIVIVDPNQFEVVADLSAGMSDRVRPGSTALVTEARSPQAGQSGVSLTELAEIQGSIYAVNPAVSPGNRAIQATARIASGSANLQHGVSVTLWIAVAEQADTVVVPLNAIAFRARVPYVFAVNPETNTVEQRQVELGIEGFDRREILSGVQVGEQLVTEGQSGLVNGARVQVIPERFTSHRRTILDGSK